jgi:hypothetical protein
MNDNDDILDFIETHRAARVLSDKAEADYNAVDDQDETLAGAMLTALRIERRLYEALLTAKPSTIEGMVALIRYVDEVSQHRKERGDFDDSPKILMANLQEIIRLAA